MDGMLWGPGADAELAYRRERIESVRRGRRPGAGTGSDAAAGRGTARHRRPGRATRAGRTARTALGVGARASMPGADPARGWSLPGSGAWPAA